MLFKQYLRETPNQKISDEEALVWCYRNANTEWTNANNDLEIIINLCSCYAQGVDFIKMIRSHIDYVSNQISNNSNQILIPNAKGSNSNESSSNEDLTKRIENEIECLKSMQILLQKKFRLMSIMRKELTQSKCECITNSNNNIYNHLRKCEFNCMMWFRQIKLIEAKIKCNKELVPFDPLTIARQLLENNELNLNWNSIEVDINNNDVNNTHIKIEKFKDNDKSNDLAANDCSLSDESYSKAYESENPFIDLRNMHTLGYDLSLSISGENSSMALQPISSNEMTTTTEMDCETRTFHELHPISSNVGLNYSAHEISLMRSNALLHQQFDCNHISHDLLPHITAVEIDQILNN